MIERLSWLRRLKKSDPEPPLRLPLPPVEPDRGSPLPPG